MAIENIASSKFGNQNMIVMPVMYPGQMGQQNYAMPQPQKEAENIEVVIYQDTGKAEIIKRPIGNLNCI